MVALLPGAIAVYVLFSAGLVYAIGAIGVFIKDLREIVTVILSVAFFAHPILYTPGQAPAWLDPFFTLSPFSHIIWCFRDALVDGDVTHPWSWVVAPACGIMFFAFGWRIFRTLKATFGNAL
jgi:lipopolysaccharide transport system permease protein